MIGSYYLILFLLLLDPITTIELIQLRNVVEKTSLLFLILFLKYHSPFLSVFFYPRIIFLLGYENGNTQKMKFMSCMKLLYMT